MNNIEIIELKKKKEEKITLTKNQYLQVSCI